LLVTKELSSAGLVAAGASDRVAADEASAVFNSVIPIEVGAASDIGGAPGSVTATRAFAVGEEDALAEAAFAEAAFAAAVEAPESEAEDGVDADEGTPRPSAAKADGPNNANSMAATATLTSSPPDVS
jgi:hypothetical protein